ncbi:EAL domain-containing protein [Ferrimonas sediminicola]|uniref:cyclic-guanylate-specific phosphodiesterase n=1 Tax=Ferrimonas sediminicola TaxID=2569538 RepID=A0A4U1BF16_9GAMM|nr:EAL domain-containing protein [Ferrimonas sediminicola]TKB49834.1 EAL domain-containing protein [Ferrimonas sediminicola]
MTLKSVIALGLSVLLLPPLSWGDSLQPVNKFQHLSTTQGLSQSVVTSIAQDKVGMLWVGTLEGLNRFDGHEFKIFRHQDSNPNSLSSNTILSQVYLDSIDTLVIATQTTLDIYNITEDHFETLALPEGMKVSHLQREEDVVWIASNIGVFRLDTQSMEFEKVVDGVNAVKFIPFEKGGIALLYDGSIVNKNTSLKIPDKQAFSDLDKYGDRIFLLGEESISVVERGEKRVFNLGSGYQKLKYNPQDDNIYAVSRDKVFSVQLSKSGSAGRVYNNKSESLAITTLFFDRDGSLLIGTNGNGIFRKSSKEKIVEKLSHPDLTDIWGAQQYGEFLLLAENDPVLHLYDHSYQKARSIDTGISGPKGINEYAGKLLISGKNKLIIVDKNLEQVVLHHQATFSAIIPDPYSANIYLGTVEHGLMMLKNINGEPRIEKAPVDRRINMPILNGAATKQALFVGTQTGAVQLTKLNGSLVRNGEFLKGRIVSGVKYSEGRILAQSLDNGIFEISSSGQSTQISDLNNYIAYSFEVTGDRIISASSAGLLVLDKSTGEILKIFGNKQGSLNDFNGMASGKFDDTLIFGGSEGINLVSDFNKYREPRIAPVLTSFRIFNKDVNVGLNLKQAIPYAESVTLKYSDYPFSFSFSSPQEALDHNLQYFYRLEGLDDHWLEADASAHAATYTNVPYGNYTFQVKSTDRLGHESPIRSLNVVILPPWWLSNLARGLYALVILSLMLLALRSIQQRRLVQLRIAQSEERLKLSLWGSGDEMWDWDIRSGRIYRSNIWGTLDFPQDGQRSAPTDNGNIHPNDRERVQKALEAHFTGDVDHFEATYRVRDKQHNWVWILDRAKIVERDGDDNPTRMTGTIKDISKLKEAEERLTIFARALTNISEGMFILDANFHYLELNDSACKILGHQRQDLTGTPLSLGDLDAGYFQEISNIVKIQGSWTSELEHLRPDGRRICLDVVIDLIKAEDNQPSYFVGILTDITHRKQNETELRRLTNNDVLTGLPNRTYLQISLDARIKRESAHCLFVFDLDNFKRINETLGHDVGDSLLCHVANRLNAQLTNDCELYRLGGDEFAVIADNDASIKNATKIATRILNTFAQPFLIEEEEIVVNASIGIVSYPEDDSDPHALLRKADLAMYHAKSEGGQSFQFFNDFMNQDAVRRFEVEAMIRQALRENWFELHYQPKMALSDDSIFGMEALVRINHPTQGLLYPDKFIALAEETGLIADIDLWVLRQACATAQHWRKAGLLRGRMAVNISGQQFASKQLCHRLHAILEETGLPPESLELEITEGAVIEHPEEAISIMQELNKMHIHLALDDFGTGYSSLSYLKRFPINTLKIDKSFIDDIAVSDKDMKMVDSIITIAHNMNLQVVAEGIEDGSQLTVLKALKCELIQGYHFSKPLKKNDIEQKLKNELNKLTV